MSKERLEETNKLKNIINSLDDSADADDFHKFVDTCQINYEEGVFNEILRFMQSQAERVQELEDLAEHHLKMLKYCSDARKKYYGVIKKLYEFDGDVQEHSALADMLCGDVLEGLE